MFDPQKNKTIIVTSLITLAAGITVMLGWVFNIRALQSLVPGLVPMVFNIALCFVLFSSALLVSQYPIAKYRTPVFFILSLIGTSIGALTILQYIFHFNSGLDQLVVKDWRHAYTVLAYELSPGNGRKTLTSPFYPGRMSFNTALCFVLLGSGFLLLTAKKEVLVRTAQYLFHAVNIFAAVIAIGYLYGVSLVQTLTYTASMSLQTTVLFLAISLAASLLNPSVGIAGLFTGRLVGNKMIRRLFGLVILVVFAFGMLRIETNSYQLSLNTWVSIVSICFLLVCLLILWNTALWLNKMDISRTVAEENVSRINSGLEEMIRDRTLAFQKSEAKYRLLIEHASDAIYVVDVNGAFTEVNDSMCRMTGYSKDELLAMNIEQIIDPNELKTDPVKHGPRNAGESIMRERRLLRKDGAIFNAEINVKRFEDDRVLVIARDITGRKKMEAELKEAELKFRTLAEQSMVGIYIFQRGQFTYVNPRFAEIFGYEPHELIGTYPVDVIIHPDYRSTVKENVRKRMEEEVPSIHYEVMGLRKDGSSNWIEFYGNRVLIADEPTIIGTMLDITERKLNEELILREKNLSDSIINSLPGVFYLQNEKGKLLRWNNNLESVFGYSAQELRTMDENSLIAAEDREKISKAIDVGFKEGFVLVEARGMLKDGTKIPFLFTGIPILYEGQQCLLGTGIDISSRIKAEEELRLSEQKYKFLFESSPLPLWMITKDDMTIIAVNKTAADMYGYTRDELIAKSVNMIRIPEDQDRQLAGPANAEPGAIDAGVVKHLKKDGTVMFVNIVANDIIFDGRAVRLAFTNDITKRLKAEESLKKSEANLQTILNTTDTAYGLFDSELKALAFNQKAIEFTEKYYHYTPKKGDLITDYYSKERLPQFMSFASEVLQGKNVNYQVDYPMENNEVSWYDVSLSPITDKSKKILGLLLTLNDVTEQKKAEQDLRRAYSRIQEQISSIKNMAWKQSHLMRSPLANLKALAGLLKDQPSDTESLAHFQTELDRLDAIIHEMAKDASDHVVND